MLDIWYFILCHIRQNVAVFILLTVRRCIWLYMVYLQKFFSICHSNWRCKYHIWFYFFSFIYFYKTKVPYSKNISTSVVFEDPEDDLMILRKCLSVSFFVSRLLFGEGWGSVSNINFISRTRARTYNIFYSVIPWYKMELICIWYASLNFVFVFFLFKNTWKGEVKL